MHDVGKHTETLLNNEALRSFVSNDSQLRIWHRSKGPEELIITQSDFQLGSSKTLNSRLRFLFHSNRVTSRRGTNLFERFGCQTLWRVWKAAMRMVKWSETVIE